MEKILIFDNYDSFTYNIVHLVNSLGYDADVYRNDRISIEQAGAYERMIISPGPGLPCESGILPELLRRYAPHKSILGICLGHQAIGECFGAHLENLPHVYHGVATPVKVIGQDPIFDGLGGEFTVGRFRRGFPVVPECYGQGRQRADNGACAPEVRCARGAVPPGIHTYSPGAYTDEKLAFHAAAIDRSMFLSGEDSLRTRPKESGIKNERDN